MESAENDQQDMSLKDQEDLSTDKHSRFNLRKLNIPPLKRDHSRSLDYTSQYQKGNNNKLNQCPVDPQLKIHESNKIQMNSPSPVNITPSRSRKTSQIIDQDILSKSNTQNPNQRSAQSSLDQRRETRRKFNLRENLSPQQLQKNGEFMHGQGGEQDSKTTGRWSREEHEKFIEAMSLYGRDWKKVEQHIGSRSGAQIRSHAQKFFNRIEKELGQDVDTYIQSKAQSLFKRGVPTFNHDESHDVQMRKSSLMINEQYPQQARDRSISHTFGLNFDHLGALKQEAIKIEDQSGKDIKGKAHLSNNNLINSNLSKQIVTDKNQFTRSKFGQSLAQETPLQRVLKESFNNYSSPYKIENTKESEKKLEEIIIEKNQIASNLIKNYHEILNNPITIQEFITNYKSLHQQITTDILPESHTFTPEAYEATLATFIEIQNNLHLLEQLQMFVGLSLSHKYDQSMNLISPDLPTKIMNSSPSQINPTSAAHNNENSTDHHQSPADSITKLLQQYQSTNKRKLSDFVERGSHTNEDSIRKRDQKFNDKQDEQAMKHLRVPDSAFKALAASSFQPTNRGSIESIRKLRAASTSNESGILNVEKVNSPAAADRPQAQEGFQEQGKVSTQERQMSNDSQIAKEDKDQLSHE